MASNCNIVPSEYCAEKRKNQNFGGRKLGQNVENRAKFLEKLL